MTAAGTSWTKSARAEPAASQSRAPAGASAAVVIPARLASQRFPRKVLARDTGKFLIQHVWEGVQGTRGVSRIIIATDSDEVMRAAASFGAEVRLTRADHPTGTDRVAEVAAGLDEAIIVNVQGDEPLIRREDLETVIALFGAGPDVVMTTLAVERRDPEGKLDANNVKVVLGRDGRALYFSRAPIPHLRDAGGAGGAGATWLHHVGVYGFRREFLLDFARMRPGKLEELERLEQLRAIEDGRRIQVGLTAHRYRGIDTHEEYREFVRELGRR